MARGNNKRQAIIKTVLKEEQPDIPVEPIPSNAKAFFHTVYDPIATESIVSKADMDATKEVALRLYDDAEAIKAFNWMAERIAIHQEYIDGKKGRAEMKRAFDRLPDYVKSVITTKPEMIPMLYRGGNHPANPGPGGDVNAGFSLNPNVYTGFGPQVYGVSDMVSHQAVVNVSRFWDLHEKLAKVIAEKGGGYGRSLSENAGVAANRDWLRISRKFSAEDEHIIFGIKWRDDAEKRAAKRKEMFKAQQS